MKKEISIPHNSKICLALVPAIIVPFIASLFYFILFTGSELSQATYVGAKFFILLWPVFSLWIINGKTFPKVEIKTLIHVNAIPVGILSGIMISIIMFGLMGTPLGGMVLESSERIRMKTEGLGVLEHYWAFAIFLCLFHSLLEEYYWRWFIYGNLRRLIRPFNAHLVAGAAFAAHHIVIASQFFPNPWGFILGGLVGIGGIIWSIMYEKQGTLAGAWTSHLMADLTIMVIGHKILFGNYL